MTGGGLKISGVMPLRNAVKLGYPFELAIKSLRALCDEVVILVDPASEDDTLARVRALGPDKIVESVWDMSNHKGHTNCEISVQTQKVCDAASGDWVMSLQADEVLHEKEVPGIRKAVEVADESGAATGIELSRLYFYGGLDRCRKDWTLWLLRLFKRGLWKPDVDGAMRFDPVGEQRRWQIPSHIYHYSRVGDPQQIAERVRNLDGFFHAPENIRRGKIDPYDFSEMRKLDTYVVGAGREVEPCADVTHFPIDGHPRGVRELFG